MIKPSISRFILATLCLALSASIAWAGEEKLLQGEEGFVAQMGERAIFIAPGIYEVRLASGVRVRVGFGEDARRYDQARLQDELRKAKTAPDAALHSRKIQILTRALRGLADEAPGDKTAVTGSTCKYPFTLDGGFYPTLVGGQSWGTASIGTTSSLPSYPRRAAYTYVSATGDETFEDERFKQILLGPGVATTSIAVDCGLVFDCTSWLSFSYVREYQCTDGYRSMEWMG